MTAGDGGPIFGPPVFSRIRALPPRLDDTDAGACQVPLLDSPHDVFAILSPYIAATLARRYQIKRNCLRMEFVWSQPNFPASAYGPTKIAHEP